MDIFPLKLRRICSRTFQVVFEAMIPLLHLVPGLLRFRPAANHLAL